MRVSVIIPTRNAAGVLDELLASLHRQTRRPDEILVVDSESTDATGEIAARRGALYHQIKAAEFDHGSTRNMAAGKVTGDILVYFTQDSRPADDKTLEEICACFDDPAIGAAYGRQLPKSGAGHIGAHARLFNYPDVSYVRSMSDSVRFGLKTAFMSNSFAAYRREALKAVGGFPEDTILSEDMCAAGRMLIAGWKIAYSSGAKVFHSHDYGVLEEFRRYFDIGVFHASQEWLRRDFGKAEGEGGRFIVSEAKYLLRNAPLLLPYAAIKNAFKYAGYRLGILHRFLPCGMKRLMSMNRKYWD